MSGIEHIEKWLTKAIVFESSHRPVPLTEYIFDCSKGYLEEAPPKKAYKRDARTELQDSVDMTLTNTR
jgi:hypothetical protein